MPFTLATFAANGLLELYETADVIVVTSEPVVAVGDETVAEPDVTIWVQGAQGDAVEDQVAAIAAPTVRVYAAAAATQDEVLAAGGYSNPPGVITVFSEPVLFTQDESAAAPVKVHVFAVVDGLESTTGSAATTTRVFVSASATMSETVTIDSYSRSPAEPRPGNIVIAVARTRTLTVRG
jgi:hypothetical protein